MNKERNYEDSILVFYLKIFGIILCIVTVFNIFFWSPDVVMMIKHKTFDIPPNYTIITNGKEYRYRDPEGDMNSFDRFYKRKAISDAWRCYDVNAKYKRKLPESWEIEQRNQRDSI